MDLDSLKRYIENSNINFLIGSGASTPHLSILSEIETLLTDLAENKDEFTEKEFVIIDSSIKAHYFNKSVKGNREFIESKPSKEARQTHETYTSFLKTIHQLVSIRKSNLQSKQVNLFTTNMDLHLEFGIEKLEFRYNDGFQGHISPIFKTQNFGTSIFQKTPYFDITSEVTTFNVFKLHGSVNWKETNEAINLDTRLVLLRQILRKLPKQENLLKLKDINFLGLDNKFLKDQITELNLDTTERHEDFLKEYNSLVMINPTKEKFATTTRNLTFYELLRLYSNYLEREASTLFVIGFSFADEHILEITKRVVHSNPTLTVIIFAYSQKDIEAFKKKFPNKANVIVVAPTMGGQLSFENTSKLYFEEVLKDLLSPTK